MWFNDTNSYSIHADIACLTTHMTNEMHVSLASLSLIYYPCTIASSHFHSLQAPHYYHCTGSNGVHIKPIQTYIIQSSLYSCVFLHAFILDSLWISEYGWMNEWLTEWIRHGMWCLPSLLLKLFNLKYFAHVIFLI